MTPSTAVSSSRKRAVPTISQKEPQRKVTFQTSVEGRQTLHINDYTEQEVRDCWISSTEQQAIYVDIRRTLNRVRVCGHSAIHEESICVRGLGDFVSKKQRQHATLRVLTGQRWNYHPDRIAMAYAKASAKSLSDAQARAAQDERDALCKPNEADDYVSENAPSYSLVF